MAKLSNCSASTSNVDLLYIEEDSWGVSDFTRDLKKLRLTGESFSFNRATTQSDEITGNRQIKELVGLGVEAGGGFNIELSMGTYDHLFEGTLCSRWTQLNDVGIAVTITNGRLLFVNPSDEVISQFKVGVMLEFSGFQEEGNNGFKQINEVEKEINGNDTIYILDVNKSLVDTDLVDVFLSVNYLINGSDRFSYFFEKRFTDINKILTYSGMQVNSFNLDFASESKITGSFDFLGKDSEALEQSNFSSILQATESRILNSGDDLGVIKEGGVANSIIQSASLSISNNLRGDKALGVKGNFCVGTGNFEVTGNIALYFRDFSVYQKYLNNESTSLSFNIVDYDTKESYNFYLGKIKFSEAPIQAGGSNESVLINGSFQALASEASGGTIIINRYKEEN